MGLWNIPSHFPHEITPGNRDTWSFGSKTAALLSSASFCLPRKENFALKFSFPGGSEQGTFSPDSWISPHLLQLKVGLLERDHFHGKPLLNCLQMLPAHT